MSKKEIYSSINIYMWNWQDKNWPQFEYSLEENTEIWNDFQKQFHIFIGALLHMNSNEKKSLFIDILSYEALETSRIEGELFSRDSIQSSLLKNFGLTTKNNKATPKEQGIAKAFQYNYSHFSKPLSNTILFQWNSLLLYGKENIVMQYRNTPVYIVSYGGMSPKVHFEGVLHEKLSNEMQQFLQWFEVSKNTLNPLVRASIAHLYFTSIHPFEDGNGRISRMLSEKCISESLGQPALLSLSLAIQEKKSEYYKQLQYTNKTLEISNWITYFSRLILRSQEISLEIFQFTLYKKQFYEKYLEQINIRQQKCIARIFDAGIYGFEGGINAKKYMKITHASSATKTRDLNDLVQKNIFIKTGTFKNARYELIKNKFTPPKWKTLS